MKLGASYLLQKGAVDYGNDRFYVHVNSLLANMEIGNGVKEGEGWRSIDERNNKINQWTQQPARVLIRWVLLYRHLLHPNLLLKHQ